VAEAPQVSAVPSERQGGRPWSALAAQALRAARAVQSVSEDRPSAVVAQPVERWVVAALAPLGPRIEAERAAPEL
jgi:hypothetical protein